MKSSPQALGVIKFVMNNVYEEFVHVGKVVLPLESLGIYVTESDTLVFNSVSINVSNPNYAEVITDVSPSLNNARLKYSLKRRRVKYVMPYGLM